MKLSMIVWQVTTEPLGPAKNNTWSSQKGLRKAFSNEEWQFPDGKKDHPVFLTLTALFVLSWCQVFFEAMCLACAGATSGALVILNDACMTLSCHCGAVLSGSYNVLLCHCILLL